MYKVIFLISSLCLSFSFPLKGQDIIGIIEENKNVNYLQIANDLFEHKHYYEAIEYFKQELKEKHNKREELDIINKLAFCYLKSRYYKKAEEYYNKILNSTSLLDPSIYFYTGKSLQAQEKYVKALDFFNQFISHKDEQPESLVDQARKNILSCRITLQKILEKESSVDVFMLKASVNKKYANYGPCFYDQKLWFSATESLNRSKKIYLKNTKGKYHNYFVDRLYVSHIKEDGWRRREEKKIKFPGDYSSVLAPAFTPDGKSILYTLCDDSMRCHIFISDYHNDKIKNPRKIPSPVNIDGYSSKHPMVSEINNKDVLFFASDRESSSNNYDLYFCYFENRQPGKIHKLGNKINTRYDEITPFYDFRDTILYFSSNGHYGMGNFDIFYIKGDPYHGWDNVVNPGPPVNSGVDDYYYHRAYDGNQTLQFFSSNRKNKPFYYESTCCDKIYQITPKEHEQLMLSGTIIDTADNKPIEADVYLIDRRANNIVDSSSTNEKGEFRIPITEPKKYDLEILAKGYMYFTKPIDPARLEENKSINIENISLTKVEEGAKVILKNIYFEINKATLKPKSYTELNRIALFLKKNPGIKIEISGHTDNTGTFEYNKRLSEKRAKNVAGYLTSKKIPETRIAYKGYAFQQPIATNQTPEGRELNRRVEFKIIEDIKE